MDDTLGDKRTIEEASYTVRKLVDLPISGMSLSLIVRVAEKEFPGVPLEKVFIEVVGCCGLETLTMSIA